MKKKCRFSLIALLLVGGALCTQTQAAIVFSDGFQSDNLNNWSTIGSGVLVADPAGGGGYALTFTTLASGGDVWSQPFSGGNYISFEYYGRTVGTGAGGFMGINGAWFAGDVPYGGNSILLVNDNSWHSYQLYLPGASGELMLELWGGSASVPGNGFFRDIVVSTTPVPEPTTLIAGLGALGLVLAGLRSRRSQVNRIGK